MGGELISFRVAGLPVGQPRVRPAVRAGRLAVYAPRSAEHWRLMVELAAREVWRGDALEGPLAVEIAWSFERPLRHFTANGALRLSAPRFPAVKPDVDNLAKSTLDALNGVLWRDDAQVVRATLEKRWADFWETQGASITIRTLP